MSAKELLVNLITKHSVMLKAYHENNEDVRKYWESDSNPYNNEVKAEQLSEALREAQSTMIAVGQTSKQEFNAIINAEIERIQAATKRDGNFDVAFANALSTINLIGNKLDDETAFGIVHPFLGDYQAMHQLRLVLNNRENANITASVLAVYDDMLADLNTISIVNNGMFDIRSSGLEFNIATSMLMDRLTEYDEMEAKLNTFIAAEGGIKKTFEKHKALRFGGNRNSGDVSSNATQSRSFREALEEHYGGNA